MSSKEDWSEYLYDMIWTSEKWEHDVVCAKCGVMIRHTVINVADTMSIWICPHCLTSEVVVDE